MSYDRMVEGLSDIEERMQSAEYFLRLALDITEVDTGKWPKTRRGLNRMMRRIQKLFGDLEATREAYADERLIQYDESRKQYHY